jgi:hypothetical protein
MRIRLPKNNKGFPIRPPTDEEREDYLNQEQVLRRIRGNIIAHTIEIENWIDVIIVFFFFGGGFKKDDKQLERIKLFENMLLNREWFTLMNKWKLLRDLLKENKKEDKELIRNLHKCINIRDRFSHGRIDFDLTGKKPIPILVYFEGENKEDILDNKYFDELNHLFSNTLKRLSDFNAEIGY